MANTLAGDLGDRTTGALLEVHVRRIVATRVAFERPPTHHGSNDGRQINTALSSSLMSTGPIDLAQTRLDNALALFDEFVRMTARHADAATLRGLERRFAERVQIQPSYWSQIKGRSRQIGERLARQFEHLCHKPRGWMDAPHGAAASGSSTLSSTIFSTISSATTSGFAVEPSASESLPRDDDERFIVGLVLTYYRRHPQRARTRLLDLLGEVLSPSPASAAGAPSAARPNKLAPAANLAADAEDLWRRSQAGVAPLKRRK